MSRQIKPVRPIRPLAEKAATPIMQKPNVNPRKSRSLFLIMLSVPLIAVSSLALYHRIYQGQEKHIQTGEYTPDGGIRMFSKEEQEKRDSQTFLTRIFGKG